MPELVLVRNNASGPTVFTDSATKDSVEWQGRGQEGDLQHVPDTYLQNPNFRRSIDRGVLEVVDASPEIMEKLAAQNAAWQNRQDQIAKAALDTMDQPANNDMVGVACIGPNPRGNGECGIGVPIRANEMDQRPPLCSMHSHLAHEFVLSYDTEIVDSEDSDGKVKPKWSRMTIGAPLPSQQ